MDDQTALGGWPRWMPLTIAARYAGCSVDTVRRLIEEGRLPSYSLRGRPVLDRLEIDAMVRGQRREPQPAS